MDKGFASVIKQSQRERERKGRERERESETRGRKKETFFGVAWRQKKTGLDSMTGRGRGCIL